MAGSVNKAFSEDSGNSSGRRTKAPLAKGSGVLLQKDSHMEGKRSHKKRLLKKKCSSRSSQRDRVGGEVGECFYSPGWKLVSSATVRDGGS